MNKFDRVISTLVLLQSRRILTSKDIAKRFDVSLRTVYRDISTLKNAGIPIIGDPGVGYSIMDGYRLPPLMFNDGEAASLLTAEKYMGNVTDKETQAYYSSALTKIKAILRSSEKQSLEVLDDSIAFTGNNVWEHKTYLQELFKSIATKSTLKMKYKKADETVTNRKVEPIGCYHQYMNWYLVAFCRMQEDYRTFKMNRILDLQVLDESFDREHIGLQEYIDQQNEAWKAKQQFQTIEIVFNKSLAKFAERRKYYFGYISQTETQDGIHMQFLSTNLELMARWLLQFGNQANVLAPIELKDRMKHLAKEFYEHYH